jgi:hypothetical protein
MYAPQSQRLSLQMKKLSTAAKLTHTMYGKSSKPAAFDILKKYKIVSAIAIQSTAMSMSPARGDLRPKNSTDQARLKTNCAPKQPRTTLTLLSARPARHMRKSDIPMSKKSVIHTGENTQLGGVKAGFSSVTYQVGIDGLVKKEPMNPTHWHISIQITRVTTSCLLISTISVLLSVVMGIDCICTITLLYNMGYSSCTAFCTNGRDETQFSYIFDK